MSLIKKLKSFFTPMVHCPVCLKSFDKEANMKRHLKAKTDSEHKEYVGLFCK